MFFQTKAYVFCASLLLGAALMSGCTMVSPQPSPAAQATEAAATAMAPTAQAPVTSTAPLQGSLKWQGPATLDPADTTACARLNIQGDQATVGACDGTTSTVALGERYGQEWHEIQARFAAFTYAEGSNTLDLAGAGSTSGEVWARALLAWARARYAELSSGKVSAAVNTVLSWFPGQLEHEQNVCKHLTVLSWGYAYAETLDCGNNNLLQSTGGWLDTTELEQLDPWLYQRAPLYQDNNYVAGVGQQAFTTAQSDEVGQWATAVWARLWAQKDTAAAPAAAATSAAAASVTGCVAATADVKVWTDAAGGYCILYPAAYTVEQTSPAEVAVVLGSVMNHTDPRVSIGVEDAAGRGLQAAADALATNYALPGATVEPVALTIDGADALMFDNLPGQDFNRRLVFIHNGRLYSLFFTPLGDSEATRAKLESFYQGIVDSFRFIEPVATQ